MILAPLLLRAVPIVMGILSIASAHSLDADLNLSTISFIHGLLGARQVAPINVPPQCKSACDPVNAVITNGCSPTQCCTARFEQQYFDCILCVGRALNLTDYSSAQNVLDSFAAQCAVRNLDIPKLTFPGQGGSSASSSRSSSTRTTSQSQSQSRSTTTSPTAPSTSTAPFNPTAASSPPPTPSPPISQQTVTSLPTTTDPLPIPTTSNGSWRGYGVLWVQAVLIGLVPVVGLLMA